MSNVIIVGGGAAGMLAAVSASISGADVFLCEKNEKLGKKLFITGKGRCNLTNACEQEQFFGKIITNSGFLYSAFHHFSNQDTIDFFEEIGLPVKVERGGRVFPQSDHSSDVIHVLSDKMKQLKVHVLLSSKVQDILIEQGRVTGVLLENGRRLHADACILATGGLSYPSTGSTGDGYRFAKKAGHQITDLCPSLTSIHVKEKFVQELEGLSLKNVKLKVILDDVKRIYEDLGEMLFTSNGISGPLVLSASRYAAQYSGKGHIRLSVDLKPALTEDDLNSRILKDFEINKNKQFKNSLNKLLPQKIIHVIIERCGIHPEKPINAITKTERMNLIKLLKNFTLEYQALGDYNEAVVTMGGVAVKEVNPSTMESKFVKGLYFAGEVLDMDALTGGYNLQIAWSTGSLAGSSAAGELISH